MSKLIAYPTAKLAKEKGFDERTEDCYFDRDQSFCSRMSCLNRTDGDFFTSAPTKSELQDWFIEKHGVAVLADLDCTLSWIWKIIPLHPEASIQEQFVSSGVHSTKQLALEEGLFEALIKLK